MNNRLMYLTSFSLPFYFNFFTLWLLSGALLFECITVNKEKLWNFNADILVFVLYLGFLFNPISQVLICKGIQALRKLYLHPQWCLFSYSFLSTCYVNIFVFSKLNYYCMFWGSNNQSWLLCNCCGSKASHDLGLVKAENDILDWRVTLFLLTSGPINFGGIWTSQYKDINQVHLFLSVDAVRKKFLWSQLGSLLLEEHQSAEMF